MSIMMERYLRRAGISTPMGRVLDEATARKNQKVPYKGKPLEIKYHGFQMDVYWGGQGVGRFDAMDFDDEEKSRKADLQRAAEFVDDSIKYGQVDEATKAPMTESKYPFKVYGYYINSNERDKFYADVRTPTQKTVYGVMSDDETGEIPEVEDGFMKSGVDVIGLEKHLKQLNLIPHDAKILSRREFEDEMDKMESKRSPKKSAISIVEYVGDGKLELVTADNFGHLEIGDHKMKSRGHITDVEFQGWVVPHSHGQKAHHDLDDPDKVNLLFKDRDDGDTFEAYHHNGKYCIGSSADPIYVKQV